MPLLNIFSGGYCNDAVSRSYYAMIYASRALLAARNLHPKGHKGLVLQFGLELVKKGYIDIWKSALPCKGTPGNRGLQHRCSDG
nr:HEPN domain-containing protein [uncultured Methanoregula sp.]